MRKRKAIYALSALLLLGGVSIVGLTSCGPTEPDPGPNPGPVVDTKIDGFTLELSGSSEIVIGETVNAVAIQQALMVFLHMTLQVEMALCLSTIMAQLPV